MMQTSERGKAELAGHEGIVLKPYKDSVGVWTVGIGHTAHAGEPDPYEMFQNGEELSLDDARLLFDNDLKKYEARVRKAFTRKLTQTQFDAAVSFDYNTGGILNAWWVRSWEKGWNDRAIDQILNWSKPKSILDRRKREQKLFAEGVYFHQHIPVYTADNKGNVAWASRRLISVDEFMAEETEKQPLIVEAEPQPQPQKELPLTGDVTEYKDKLIEVYALLTHRIEEDTTRLSELRETAKQVAKLVAK